MTLTLINATRRMKVVNLPHDVYCAALGACACTEVARGRRIAASLTLPAGSTTPGLDDAVLKHSRYAVQFYRREGIGEGEQ